MDHALTMRGLERRGDLAADLHRRRGREATATVLEPLGQRLAVEQLHDDERGAVGARAGAPDLAALVDRDDAGVDHLGDRARLLNEPLHQLRVGAVVRVQELDREVAVKRRVTRNEDDAEATLAELARQLVLADPKTDLERLTLRHLRAISWNAPAPLAGFFPETVDRACYRLVSG